MLGPQGVEPVGPATELTLVRLGRTSWHRENLCPGSRANHRASRLAAHRIRRTPPAVPHPSITRRTR